MLFQHWWSSCVCLYQPLSQEIFHTMLAATRMYYYEKPIAMCIYLDLTVWNLVYIACIETKSDVTWILATICFIVCLISILLIKIVHFHFLQRGTASITPSQWGMVGGSALISAAMPVLMTEKGPSHYQAAPRESTAANTTLNTHMLTTSSIWVIWWVSYSLWHSFQIVSMIFLCL